MKLSDFEELYTLWKKAGLNLSDYQKEKEEFTMMIKLNPHSCLMGVENNKIIGSVLAIFNGRRGWIHHLSIDPEFQKLGLGTKLVKEAEKRLAKLGTKKVLLWVDHSNLRVIPFYEKHNYEIISDALLFGKNI